MGVYPYRSDERRPSLLLSCHQSHCEAQQETINPLARIHFYPGEGRSNGTEIHGESEKGREEKSGADAAVDWKRRGKAVGEKVRVCVRVCVCARKRVGVKDDSEATLY